MGLDANPPKGGFTPNIEGPPKDDEEVPKEGAKGVSKATVEVPKAGGDGEP